MIFTWSTTNIEITTLKSWNELTETEFSAYTNIILQIKNVHLSIHILFFMSYQFCLFHVKYRQINFMNHPDFWKLIIIPFFFFLKKIDLFIIKNNIFYVKFGQLWFV